MTIAHQLASFARRVRFGDLSNAEREQLALRILDAIACALGALGADPVQRLRRHVDLLGGHPLVTLIGGGTTAPDRAALYNGFLVRYLDFNDSYLAPGETCHPSDNLGCVLAAAELGQASGKDLLAALAVAYQVQARLSDEAPVRARGFDHTVQALYAGAAGAARALDLSVEQTANALCIAGTALNALRVTRTGALSHWKGLAAPHALAGALHAALMARQGITGPPEVFEGTKGLMDAITGPFEVDWEREDTSRVLRTIVKKYNAEIHSQSAIEGILELRQRHGIDPRDVSTIRIQIFDVAVDIIGGGLEGDKHQVGSKEEADHSLPYMAAVALLDGALGPAQYEPERILRHDVQSLLRRVEIERSPETSRRFPEAMPCHVTLAMRDGAHLRIEKDDYEGFHTRPATWDGVVAKLHTLGAGQDPDLLQALVSMVRNLETVEVRRLTAALARVRQPEHAP